MSTSAAPCQRAHTLALRLSPLQPLANDADRQRTRPRHGRATFASVSYGDVAQLLANCLTLRDLAAWAQTHRDGRRAVAHKLTHFGSLSLAHYPLMSLEAFTQMAQRIRGLEVVMLPYTHPCLIRRGWEADWHETFEVGTGVSILLRLLDANAASLRVLSFDQEQERPRDQAQFDSALQAVAATIVDRAHRWPRCQLFCWPFFVYTSFYDRMLRRRLDTHYGLPCTEVVQPLLPEFGAEDAPHPEDNLALPAEALAQTQQLSAVLHVSEMPRLPLGFPMLEALSWAVLESRTDGGSSFTKYPRTQEDTDAALAFAAGKPVLYAADSLSRAMQSFSQLLYLSLIFCNSNMFEKFSTLRLNLPLLLHLTLSTTDGIVVGLGDIDFTCPRLLLARINILLMLPPAGGDEDDEPRMQCLPPSYILSLSRSPLLRALTAVDNEPIGPFPDFTSSLTEQQRNEMDSKAAALGQPSPFSEPVCPEKILLYALSTLPCAATLLMLEDCKILSIEEYYALFPALRLMSLMPNYMTLPPWLREGILHNPLHDSHLTQQRQQQQLRAWDRLSSEPEETAEEFAERMVATPPRVGSSLALASPTPPLDLAICTRLLQNSVAFRDLSIVYLGSPTRVDEATLRLLLTECMQLRSLSLIQLWGVGDSLFLDLPAGFVRERLEVLRCKGVCEEAMITPTRVTAEVRFGLFSHHCIPRLAQVFPRLQHLECVIVHAPTEASVAIHQAVAAQLSRHRRIPHVETMTSLRFALQPSSRRSATTVANVAHVWPNLQTLVLNEHFEESIAQASFLAVYHAWRGRLLAQSTACSCPPSSSPITLIGVRIQASSLHEDTLSWMHHGRRPAGEGLPMRYGAYGFQLQIVSEASCVGKLCYLPAHNHPPPEEQEDNEQVGEDDEPPPLADDPEFAAAVAEAEAAAEADEPAGEHA